MAAKQKWVVRIVLTEAQESALGGFVECLRYAGHASEFHYSNDGGWFDIPCPAGLDDKRWSSMNADRMKTFGFRAVATPTN